MNSQLEVLSDNEIRELFQSRFKRKRGEKLQSSRDTAEHIRAFLSEYPRDVEHFGIIHLDTQLNIIETEILSSGSLSSASVFPREIIKRVLALEGGSCICFHNHPSQELLPSGSDKALTKKLKTALDSIDNQMVDHLIVGYEKEGFFSFSDHGLL